MKLLIAGLALLVLAGCSTAMSQGQIEAMHTPTITLDCEAGCSASYTDPRDRPSMPTNGWDTMNTAINATAGVVTSTAPWAAIGITASQGIKNAVGDNSSDNSVRTDDRVTDNSVRTDSRDQSSRIDNRVDSTHDPLVVTQPEPVGIQE